MTTPTPDFPSPDDPATPEPNSAAPGPIPAPDPDLAAQIAFHQQSDRFHASQAALHQAEPLRVR